jgi:hypothetical protein
MSTELKIMMLKNRIALLSVNPENARIVKKLYRQLRNLEAKC